MRACPFCRLRKKTGTLLEDVGRPRTDIKISAEKVAGSLDIYRDLMGV